MLHTCVFIQVTGTSGHIITFHLLRPVYSLSPSKNFELCLYLSAYTAYSLQTFVPLLQSFRQPISAPSYLGLFKYSIPLQQASANTFERVTLFFVHHGIATWTVESSPTFWPSLHGAHTPWTYLTANTSGGVESVFRGRG
jgi:hypothetical protein